MRKRKVIIFASVATFALLGIILTQGLWVNDALSLRQEQFDQSVKVSLKSVSTQILDSQIDSTAKYILSPCDTILFATRAITEIIDAEFLDSLMRKEFQCMNISEDNQYGVYSSLDSSFVMGSYSGSEQQLLSSEHQVSLTCIYHDEVYFLSVYFPSLAGQILNPMIAPLILSFLFLLILSYVLFMIIKLMFKQKKLSQVKSDFINNMTHEFKTPIATISISSEMLMKETINKYPYKTKRYASVIFDENARLQKQVEQVLQLSVLEKGSFKLKLKDIDLHRIIRKMAEHFSGSVQKRGGNIQTELNAHDYHLRADKTHISNIIANLIDNAIKYSPEQPDIQIKSRNERSKFVLAVIDKGIGISPENQKHIFKKLYRVPTGNIHDVKGFGLGLYYVKTMVEAHGGSIRLKSEQNKGTTIIIEFRND